ncbi:hypothetical protein [Nitratidesulfovibrio liaohensis]|uniref:hypothetical protein n=1 Tax=Nitratidesulfovibrio liaohensis TaxID=2604158 RepID=UPI0014221548|nr:hypothetical protein [Nitratidesulfovibrio liaohensis]NHZ46298.1 hypothetical protein [Nitratidesulfovibrio liaohensis]
MVAQLLYIENKTSFCTHKKWQSKLMFFPLLLSAIIGFSGGCSDGQSISISSGQKTDIYSKIIMNEFTIKYVIPIYALNEDDVFFTSYDNNRNPINIFRFKNNKKNIAIVELTFSGEVNFISRQGLYEKNNEICYNPHAGILEKTRSKYETSPLEIFARETSIARDLEKITDCYKKNPEFANKLFDKEIIGENSRTVMRNDIQKLLFNVPAHKKHTTISQIGTLFPEELLESTGSSTQNDAIKPDTSLYRVTNKIKFASKTHMIHLSPNSKAFLINNESTRSLNMIHYHQIDESCIVFERNSDGKWSYISIIEPSWLSSASGWVPSETVSDEDTEYYKKRINDNYYPGFNATASPSIYAKLKESSSTVDQTVLHAAKKLVEKFIAEGNINIKVTNASIDPSTTQNNIAIKYMTNFGNYIYKSADDNFILQK